MSSLLTWHGEPDLVNPILLVSFGHPVEQSATATLRLLLEGEESQKICSIDPEQVFDFTTLRPTVSVSEDGSRHISWPELSVQLLPRNGRRRDVLVLSGPEPHLRWRATADAILEAASRLGVSEVAVLSAYRTWRSHRFEALLTTFSTSPPDAEQWGLESDSIDYEGPLAFGGFLHLQFAQHGIPSSFIAASIPAYVGDEPNAFAVDALLRLLERRLGLRPDRQGVDRRLAELSSALETGMAQNADFRDLVERLEHGQTGLSGDRGSEELLDEAQVVEAVRDLLRQGSRG